MAQQTQKLDDKIDLDAMEKTVNILSRRIKNLVKKNGFSKQLKEKVDKLDCG